MYFDNLIINILPFLLYPCIHRIEWIEGQIEKTNRQQEFVGELADTRQESEYFRRFLVIQLFEKPLLEQNGFKTKVYEIPSVVQLTETHGKEMYIQMYTRYTSCIPFLQTLHLVACLTTAMVAVFTPWLLAML